MANLYEILAIIHPTETDDGVSAIVGGLRQQLMNSGGTVLHVDTWGRRKLAYRIGKHDEGIYVLMHAEGPPNLPAEFRAHTRIRESILRDLVLKLEDAQEIVVRRQLEAAGPEDAKLAEAQLAAAQARAAEKRTRVAAAVAGAVAEEAGEAADTDQAQAPADEPGEEG